MKQTKFIYSNPSPSKSDNDDDCFIRALCNAMDSDYKLTFLNLLNFMYETNQLSWNSDAFVYAYMVAKLRRRTETLDCQETIGQLANELGRGIYIVSTQDHITCIKDGTIYDTWDCLHEIVEAYWRIDTEF